MFWEEEAINIWWKWLKVFFCAVIGERDIEREEGEQCDYSERVNQSFKLNWWWEGYKTRRSNEIVRKSNEIVNTIREWIKALSRDQEVLNTTCDTFKQIQVGTTTELVTHTNKYMLLLQRTCDTTRQNSRQSIFVTSEYNPHWSHQQGYTLLNLQNTRREHETKHEKNREHKTVV